MEKEERDCKMSSSACVASILSPTWLMPVPVSSSPQVQQEQYDRNQNEEEHQFNFAVTPCRKLDFGKDDQNNDDENKIIKNNDDDENDDDENDDDENDNEMEGGERNSNSEDDDDDEGNDCKNSIYVDGQVTPSYRSRHKRPQPQPVDKTRRRTKISKLKSNNNNSNLDDDDDDDDDENSLEPWLKALGGGMSTQRPRRRRRRRSWTSSANSYLVHRLQHWREASLNWDRIVEYLPRCTAKQAEDHWNECAAQYAQVLAQRYRVAPEHIQLVPRQCMERFLRRPPPPRQQRQPQRQVNQGHDKPETSFSPWRPRGRRPGWEHIQDNEDLEDVWQSSPFQSHARSLLRYPGKYEMAYFRCLDPNIDRAELLQVMNDYSIRRRRSRQPMELLRRAKPQSTEEEEVDEEGEDDDDEEEDEGDQEVVEVDVGIRYDRKDQVEVLDIGSSSSSNDNNSRKGENVGEGKFVEDNHGNNQGGKEPDEMVEQEQESDLVPEEGEDDKVKVVQQRVKKDPDADYYLHTYSDMSDQDRQPGSDDKEEEEDDDDEDETEKRSSVKNRPKEYPEEEEWNMELEEEDDDNEDDKDDSDAWIEDDGNDEDDDDDDDQEEDGGTPDDIIHDRNAPSVGPSGSLGCTETDENNENTSKSLVVVLQPSSPPIVPVVATTAAVATPPNVPEETREPAKSIMVTPDLPSSGTLAHEHDDGEKTSNRSSSCPQLRTPGSSAAAAPESSPCRESAVYRKELGGHDENKTNNNIGVFRQQVSASEKSIINNVEESSETKTKPPRIADSAKPSTALQLQASQGIVPAKNTRLEEDGTWRRPMGRSPKGKIWDAILGVWKNPTPPPLSAAQTPSGSKSGSQTAIAASLGDWASRSDGGASSTSDSGPFAAAGGVASPDESETASRRQEDHLRTRKSSRVRKRKKQWLLAGSDELQGEADQLTNRITRTRETERVEIATEPTEIKADHAEIREQTTTEQPQITTDQAETGEIE